ncbi:AzlD domain-containing protein [Cumulibacter manganitolerans]|uniref:AzlD domain-containing protein n=1 Tax=Cumulibacter manganitolerans TaxID=1884992 RepID=UPI001E565EF0|nr:AzlD domain-containing protein [Cumulibacter manganitolerans]
MLLACVGCYALKYAGMSIPQRILDSAAVRRVALLLPVGLLAALAATQTFGTGERLVVDARVVGVFLAIVAIRLRAPFIAVVAVAALGAVLARQLGMP